jgi:hypothetical protein
MRESRPPASDRSNGEALLPGSFLRIETSFPRCLGQRYPGCFPIIAPARSHTRRKPLDVPSYCRVPLGHGYAEGRRLARRPSLRGGSTPAQAQAPLPLAREAVAQTPVCGLFESEGAGGCGRCPFGRSAVPQDFIECDREQGVCESAGRRGRAGQDDAHVGPCSLPAARRTSVAASGASGVRSATPVRRGGSASSPRRVVCLGVHMRCRHLHQTSARP